MIYNYYRNIMYGFCDNVIMSVAFLGVQDTFQCNTSIAKTEVAGDINNCRLQYEDRLFTGSWKTYGACTMLEELFVGYKNRYRRRKHYFERTASS